MFLKIFKKDKDTQKRVESEKSTLATRSQIYEMKKLLEAAFSGYPAAMPVNQLAKITGYNKKKLITFTSQYYLGRKNTVIKCNGEECIQISAFIDYMASNYGFGIPDRKKSRWHKNLIKELNKKTTKCYPYA